ncbi:MAG: esterase family protein [Helicobacteraceae bacterium]|jgi:S-formylglutathione hydrolase FrmB|nr:esterase family protein [Helicobacteraceae bacterium]
MRLLLAIIVAFAPLFGAKIETIKTYSQAMRKTIEAIVIAPDAADEKIASIYLLHGYGATPNSWLEIAKDELTIAADKRKVLFVLANGGVSWYIDSPRDKSVRYETYVAKELTAQIDAQYPTIASAKARAIAGFSMGGHGALFLALKHSDTFSAVGAMAGGVDLPPFSQYWGLTRLLGDLKTYREDWIAHSAINMIERYDPSALTIRIDCGRDDFFRASNAAFAKKLRDLNASFIYEERGGGHDGAFLKAALGDQLEFLIDAVKADKR